VSTVPAPSSRSWLAAADRHLQRLTDQLGPHVIGHRPATTRREPSMNSKIACRAWALVAQV